MHHFRNNGYSSYDAWIVFLLVWGVGLGLLLIWTRPFSGDHAQRVCKRPPVPVEVIRPSYIHPNETTTETVTDSQGAVTTTVTRIEYDR